jgi:retron-type reverse transcriptase
MIIEHLSDTLFLAEHDIVSFSLTSPHRYKVYEIPKRNSKKTRTIAHPSKELKFIQRTLVEYLSRVLPIHEAAFAYKKGVGIKDNAKQHAESKYLLKMDFKDFFPSITPTLFFNVAKAHGIEFNKKDRMVLTGLLFWKPKSTDGLVLSIGAPTSPLISNFVMYTFDQRITDECFNKKITYTRYADDITFSTRIKNTLFELPLIISTLLTETVEGIVINSEKTIFTSRAHNRHVTGVTLTNEGGLSIGRERKRLISSMIHKSKFNKLSTEDASNLLGLISYAAHIEPEFHDRMIKKYGIDILQAIKDRAVGS